MDKKQAHKIGKQINKPIKVVKNNTKTLGALASATLTLYGIYKSNKKE